MLNGLPPRLANALEAADAAVRNQRGLTPDDSAWNDAYAAEWERQMRADATCPSCDGTGTLTDDHTKYTKGW